MAQPERPPSTGARSSSRSSRKDSNPWTTMKPSLVLALKATEMALDGLPIPGAKGCVSLILRVLETSDLAAGNAAALQALQSRFESLQEVLLPVYANKAVDVPDDVRKDVGNLALKLDKLAAQWKHKLEKTHQKRNFIRRLISAGDDSETLTLFAKAVEQEIQDFLVISTTNGRIAAFREDIKSREARTLQLLPRAPTASYNSIRTGGANACLQGTRVSILKTIKQWATNPDPKQPPMFWLNGLAGIGKTTIAHTIASEWDAAGLLGASFVFLRADDQLKDARLVFPTLAFQLARYNPHFRTALVQVLEQDPDCGSNLLDLQFKKLILTPLLVVSLSTPVIIILDALDECEPEKLTSELLRILHMNIQSVPFLRVFITSRPEGYIREALDLVDDTSSHRKLVLHEDIYAEEVEHDIRLFLRLRLQELWDSHTKQTSVRWPSDDDLDKLVEQSGKLFIYAATAVRFIGGNRALNLNRQLSALLTVKIGHIPHGEPYRQLDGLYLRIVESVFVDCGEDYYVLRFRNIVGSIALLERPLPLASLADLLGDYSVDEINETLYHLHSIVIVPATPLEAPRTYHLSFPDFITNPERCTNLKAFIDPGLQAKYLFHRCLAVMEKDFGPVEGDQLDEYMHENQDTIGLREDSGLAQVVSQTLDAVDEHSLVTQSTDEDEDGSEDTNLAPEIRYSDNYWCPHLMNIPPGNHEAATALERFIMGYLPKWLQRRTARILDDFQNPNARLARDTFDIIHNAYRWGSRSGCSHKFQAFVQERAKHLFGRLFPNPRVKYLFGRRLFAESIYTEPIYSTPIRTRARIAAEEAAAARIAISRSSEKQRGKFQKSAP